MVVARSQPLAVIFLHDLCHLVYVTITHLIFHHSFFAFGEC